LLRVSAGDDTKELDAKDAETSADEARSDAPTPPEEPAGADAPEEPARSVRPPRVPPREKQTLGQRATARWTAISLVMVVLLIWYTQHPYYRAQNFTPFRTLYPIAFGAWLAFGIFYCKATLEKFHERRYLMRDGGLHLILLGKALLEKKFWRRAKNPRLRTTLLAIVVKGFFTPLMLGFLSGHSNAIADAWLKHKHMPPLRIVVPPGKALFEASGLWWQQVTSRLSDFAPAWSDFSGVLSPGSWTIADWQWGLGLGYDIVFFVDVGWALIGYSLESRWLGNKTRSVEPTGFGWVVCLFCYPPFNNVLGTYLPLENGPERISDPTTLVVMKGMTVALFTIYASATVAFGFKFSNLTNRGTVSRGPYAFVRHPAYLTKCLAWWLEHLPRMTVTKAIFLSCLCGWYALRAWTEERHLSRDPDYRAYKKRVPWVLFPKVY